MQESGRQGGYSDHEPACTLRRNAQTKSRQCRGKEEESDTACCIGTPEHCGLIRRDLVVCPPFWLLPRIETGDSFLWACCAPLLRPHPQGNVPAWAFAGRTFRRLWGMSVPFSLSAPLLCQTIVAILCGNFEQFANKRATCEKRVTEKFADFSVTLKFRIMICVTPQRTPWQCRRCAWRPLRTSLRRSSRRIPGSARHRLP